MTEKEIISKIQECRKIEPSKDWVVSTKQRILGEEKRFSFIPSFDYRLAFAPAICALIFFGLFGFVRSTVPGDFFFPVKKVTENAQIGITSAMEKPRLYLKFANDRLEDLNRIAEENDVARLEPTIRDFQANIFEATAGLASMDENVTTSDPMVLKELAEETKKIEENKKKIESVLGTMVGDTGELESALSNLQKRTAENLLQDLEKRTLSEEDRKLFEEAKKDFEAGNYSQALDKIWLLSNSQQQK